MANTATQLTKVPFYIKGDQVQGVTPVVVTIDTINTDLTIHTPDSSRFVALMGINYAESSAHNITWKSGSNTLSVWEVGAGGNNGVYIPVYKPLLSTNRGESLIISSSANITTMLLYVVEYSTIII